MRAVQLLLGHTKMDRTVRYLGVELEAPWDAPQGGAAVTCQGPARQRAAHLGRRDVGHQGVAGGAADALADAVEQARRQHDAGRVDIGAGVHRLPAQLLRGHVLKGADDRSGLGVIDSAGPLPGLGLG